MESAPLYREIGSRIRARRQQLGKTQEELATTVRLSRPSLANIEGGRQTLLVHQLCQIANALQLKALDLLPEYQTSSTSDTSSALMPAGLSESQQQQIRSMLSPSNKSFVAAREHKG